jgi:anti-sigma regulatory factor (Ser/Thr protein kinase)
MSCVCILTPVIIAAWPAFSAAVAAAATSLGYSVAGELVARDQTTRVNLSGERTVQLEIAQSEIVTNQLGREQSIKVTRGDVTVTFTRDARGKAAICVTGPGHSNEELRALGEELSQRVVQKYVHQRLLDEIQTLGFNLVEEEVGENNTIRMKVRHWDG